MNLKTILESILFISDRPLSLKELAKIANNPESPTLEALEELVKEYNSRNQGILFIKAGDKYQMTTNPSSAEIIRNFLKQELEADLTPASLEALALIAYRGPILKEEIEQIRGVNSAIILRHLLIRGLIEEIKKDEKIFYAASLDFLRQLGIKNFEDLPDYQKLHDFNLQSGIK